MTDQMKNIITGLFVLAAGLIVVFMILFLHPSVGNKGQIVYVRFSDIDKVNVGTRVTYAGRPVGEVSAIYEIEKGREGKKDENGQIYIYEMKLLVDSHIRLYDSDEFILRTSGLLGERSVAIIPRAPTQGQMVHLLKPGDVIYATPAGSVEDTMRQFKDVATRFDLALDNVNAILQEVREEKVVKKISDTAENLREITAALNRPEELTAFIENIHKLSERFLVSWDTVDESLKNFEITSENTRDITKTFKAIVNKVSRGEGTAGKILMTDDLYLRMASLFNKAETVMDDINHYGILFQTDKGWQRKRARQMNLVQKLSSPQQFRNYFNDQVDQISTSLARVTTALNEADVENPNQNLVENKEFTKVFAELLRRVKEIEDSLKMYNQQLMLPEVQKTELIDGMCPMPQYQSCR